MAFFGLRSSLPRLIKRSRAPNRAIEKSRKSLLSFPPPFHAAFAPPVRAIKRTRRRRLHSAKRRERKREGKRRHLSSYFPRGRLFEPEQGFPETLSKAVAWCKGRFFQPCWAGPIKSAPPFYEVSKSFLPPLFFSLAQGRVEEKARKKEDRRKTGGCNIRLIFPRDRRRMEYDVQQSLPWITHDATSPHIKVCLKTYLVTCTDNN